MSLLRQATRLITASAMMALTAWVPDSSAFAESVTLNQSADGTVTATLSGMLYRCTYGFGGAPVVTISADQILIVSHVIGMGCPIFQVGTPFPYTQSAPLGVFADGGYTLRWTQKDTAPTFEVQQQFFVNAGNVSMASPEPIPTMSQWSLFLLALLICLAGSLRWRSMRPASERSSAPQRERL